MFLFTFENFNTFFEDVFECWYGMQALWKFILWPAIFLSVGFIVIRDPDAAVDFVTGIILFSANNPVVTSVLILFVFGVLITPYVLPVAISALVVLLLVDPSAFKSLLPAPPALPKWMLPAPVRQVRFSIARFICVSCCSVSFPFLHSVSQVLMIVMHDFVVCHVSR